MTLTPRAAAVVAALWAVAACSGDRVFVAAGVDWYHPGPYRGIYRTVDGGQTWERVLFVADDAGGVDIVIDPANPNRLFASIWQRASASAYWYVGGPASGIYRSTNGGDTWTELTAGLPTQDMGKIGLAIAPTDPNVVYANVKDYLSPLRKLLFALLRERKDGHRIQGALRDGERMWVDLMRGYHANPLDVHVERHRRLHWLARDGGGMV